MDKNLVVGKERKGKSVARDQLVVFVWRCLRGNIL